MSRPRNTNLTRLIENYLILKYTDSNVLREQLTKLGMDDPSKGNNQYFARRRKELRDRQPSEEEVITYLRVAVDTTFEEALDAREKYHNARRALEEVEEQRAAILKFLEPNS